MSAQSVAMEEDRIITLESHLHNTLSALKWMIEHARRGDLSWGELEEIKDNIKILEAKCNGNR